MTSAFVKSQNKIGCRFCSSHNLMAHNSLDEPLAVESNYFSLVSKGSLVHGWVLVFPKTHILNLAEEYHIEDFHRYTNSIKNLVESKYGKTVVFEHGSNREDSSTSCGTVHAHLHIVPLDFKFSEKVFSYDPNLKWIACNVLDVKKFANDSEYLYFTEDYKGSSTSGWICLLNKQTSQFFRKVIACELGIHEKYNYKDFAMNEIVSETLNEIKVSISQNN